MNVLSSVYLQYEQDVVSARSRGRQLAELLGLSTQDQTRVATAVSELARNALMYAGGGQVDYGVDAGDGVNVGDQRLMVRVSDQGAGIAGLDEILAGQYVSHTGMGAGLRGTRRLMDHFHVVTGPSGTQISVAKSLPPGVTLSPHEIGRFQAALDGAGPVTPVQELQRQNQELLRALSDLARREEELASLNRELGDTNRGVVALYSELEDTASLLREASREKSMFLSYVSHEFRTPLHSMLGLSRMLLSHDDGDLSGEQDEQLRLLRSSAEELLGMVNDLLDLTKAEMGGRELTLEPLDLSQVLGTLRALFQPLVTPYGPQLIVEEPATLTVLYTDAGKLHQILRNFISNALKFTRSGEVRVSTRRLEDDRWIEFSVQDSGSGIAPEDQARLFQDFSQVGVPALRTSKGSGLGLSLASRMATLLGGRVGMESVLNHGSRFWAILPLHSGTECPAIATPSAATPPLSSPGLGDPR
ncbi:ATP-binding protein [Deinococcus arenicola]|uniref:histidine kinase n=1 Tax=Deinococcus arenicola TaxID=2994950 RepID=A0ABU4DSY2_9DEIO|nr:ATP-binding protein [Deinococcus sp. ZS9-10]MDV6374794.1 ATP-binding protein [Deinococcus sp. ZS9-10]